MNAPPLPLTPAQLARATIARTVRFAKFSAGTMLVLGGISAVISVLHPISAAFLISIAVVANGLIEWQLARRLALSDARAPGRMALNQLALGVEIAAYAAWQAVHLTPEMIDGVLRRPMIAALLEALQPEQISALYDGLLPLLRAMYVVVGAGAFIGCVATAIYFRARRKQLAASAE